MSARWLPLYAVLALVPAAGSAAERAHDWLTRMHDAARRLSYDGTFVFQQGRQLELLRVVHQSEGGRVRERLVSLNGTPREIVRDDETVLCFLPDESSVVVEHRKAGTRSFPALLPERAAELEQSYLFELGPRARVVGRMAQVVVVKPRDALRYGYRLWADTETGLLLKADLVDARGETLEQFMFTQLTIGNVPKSALEPQSEGKGLRWHRAPQSNASASSEARWSVSRLPKGFRLETHVTRMGPVSKAAVEQLVYSDGLATVSVFIEKAASAAASGVEATSHMGAVHAYRRRVDGHQVTVVGEVPQATVKAMGSALVAQR